MLTQLEINATPDLDYIALDEGSNAGSMFDQRLRRWSNIEPALEKTPSCSVLSYLVVHSSVLTRMHVCKANDNGNILN